MDSSERDEPTDGVPDSPRGLDEQLRTVVERSETGAPAVGSKVRDRFATNEIYQRVVVYGDYELTAGRRELFFSGLAGGFAIAITFLLYAEVAGQTDGAPVLSAALYPLGFIYIILGGYQLYTENTLPPVALVLERLASVPLLLRVFALVLLGNAVGAALGAVVLAETGVFSTVAFETAVAIGEEGVGTAPVDLFFKGVFAGLIVAGVVWMDFAADSTAARLVLIYLAFLSIPVAGLYHVVVSFTELVFVVLAADVALLDGLVGFILPVLLGNTLGGIVLVTVVNYYQTTPRRLEAVRNPEVEDPLSLRESLLGGLVGRGYVDPAPRTDGGDGRASGGTPGASDTGLDGRTE